MSDHHRTRPGETAVPTITEIRVRFVAQPVGDLVGYGSCVLDGSWLLNDIQIRRGRDGGIVLVFPSRESASGARHYTHNPINRTVGESIRDAFVAHLERLLPEWHGNTEET